MLQAAEVLECVFVLGLNRRAIRRFQAVSFAVRVLGKVQGDLTICGRKPSAENHRVELHALGWKTIYMVEDELQSLQSRFATAQCNLWRCRCGETSCVPYHHDSPTFPAFSDLPITALFFAHRLVFDCRSHSGTGPLHSRLRSMNYTFPPCPAAYLFLSLSFVPPSLFLCY